MITITFLNGQELECETVHSHSQYYNGTNRDKLTFVFPENFGLMEIAANFTPENCKKIWLKDESGEQFLHEHYTIRFAIGVKERGALLNVAEDLDHRMVAYVEMIRTTYSEQQLEELSDTMDAMLVAQLMGGNDDG